MKFYNSFNMIRNVNIVGGRNADPACLKTRLEPIKLEGNMGISAKFIAFGEVANMSARNCDFEIEDRSLRKKFILKIPEGRYRTREDVLFAISDSINKYINNKVNMISNSLLTEDGLAKTNMNDLGKFSICLPTTIRAKVKEHGIWSILKVYEDVKDHKQYLHVFGGELEERTGMAFIYINIAENSYINGKKSRVLTAFPVSSKSGYTYHEFINTTYIPIAVNEFTDIEIELRDVSGKLLKIDNSYDTIVSMHISPINSRN